MNKDLTDKEILALGIKTPKTKKRILFKDYAVSYCNLGMANRDAKTIRKELPAIARRGADMVMKHILEKTRMPGKFPEHQKPLITVIIYAGVVDEVNGVKTFLYPNPMEDYHLEEV